MRESCGILSLILCLAFAFDATAQTQSIEEIDHQLTELEEGPAGQIAPEEISRAREMVRRVVQEREAGNTSVAHGLRPLISLQIRLIQEILRAADAENRAGAAESRLLEVTGEAGVEREALERVLERLLALTNFHEEE